MPLGKFFKKAFGGSEKSITERKVKTGFSEAQVANFLSAGNLLSTDFTPGKSFKENTPDEKVRTDFNINKKTFFSGFGGSHSSSVKSTTGFQGAFSKDVTSADQIQALANAFENRKSEVTERRRAPGRSQLFFVGR